MKAPKSFIQDCKNAIESMNALLENKDDGYAITSAAVDLKIYYNYPHERLELSKEEEALDNQVFHLSQKIEEKLGIELLYVKTY